MKKQLILSVFAALLMAAPAHAGLFGESDEEKAARLHEKDQDAAIADLTQRIHDLEDSLSRATGQNETLAHQIQQLNDKIARQQKDFEYRLCTVVQQQMGAGQAEADDQTAVNLYGKAAEKAREIFGPDHPNTLAAADEYARVVKLIKTR